MLELGSTTRENVVASPSLPDKISSRTHERKGDVNETQPEHQHNLDAPSQKQATVYHVPITEIIMLIAIPENGVKVRNNITYHKYLLNLKASNITSAQISRKVTIMPNRIPAVVVAETGKLVSIRRSQLNRP